MTKKPIAFDDQVATRGDLAAAITPLATREELHAAIATAVAPLATRAELVATEQRLKAAIAPLTTRSEMLALHESLRGDVQLLADSVLSLHAKFDARNHT